MKRNEKHTGNDGTVDCPSSTRRRELLVGAAAGLGTISVTIPSRATARKPRWDYETDVVVCGGGAAGLVCAIRARDAGDRVMVVEGNFDLGGKMLHSGGSVSLGGGDPVQRRDLAGARDPQNYVNVPPRHKPEELIDDPNLLFVDLTDWSVLNTAAEAPYRYNEREWLRAFADNAPSVRQLLMDNYVRFARISGSGPNSGISRARQAQCLMKLAQKTDIRAGTISAADAGEELVRASHFSPIPMSSLALTAGPGTVGNGAALARPLEFSAREKGVQFLLNRHLDELIREEPFKGRVLAIRASYSPRFDPDTGAQLKSLWSEGNLDEQRESIIIRARKGVMIATGGHGGNPQFRSMFYPAMRDPAYPASALAILGPRGQDASGIIAGMKVGATLAGMQENLGSSYTFHIPARLATRDAYSGELPGHPSFSYRKSTGIALGSSAFEHLIAVNQVGQRFFNELNLTKHPQPSWYPGGPPSGVPHAGLGHKPRDWRNCDPEWVREMFDKYSGTDAALQINEGSVAPDYFAGMHWAIFDQSAVDREGWDIGAPFTHPNNGYFFSADTIEELALKIHAGNEYQRVPLKYLADTVSQWNVAVDAGTDEEFGRGHDAPMHRIDTPKFYAASIMVVWHDSYGGLRINGKSQVLDLQGDVIPGLYAGGEASGGDNQHGLARAHVAGYVAGTHIHQEFTPDAPTSKPSASSVTSSQDLAAAVLSRKG